LQDRGIAPEKLPPAEDVKKVERRLAAEQKKNLSRSSPTALPTDQPET
jgi:DNA-damage-inducible protein D